MPTTPDHRSRARGNDHAVRFCSVVALRDGHHRDLAPVVARRLADEAHVPVSVVHAFAERRDGAPRDEQRDATIAELATGLSGRDGALVVIDAFGGGPAGGPLFDDAAEHVLTRVGQPVLVLGPGATPPRGRWSLVVPIDGAHPADAVLDVTARWCASFGPAPVTVVALDVPDPWPGEASDPVDDAPRHAAAWLERRAVAVDLVRHATLEPSAVLLEAPAGDPATVLVVPGLRSPGTGGHWYATARRLVRAASCPVLVVPDPQFGRAASYR